MKPQLQKAKDLLGDELLQVFAETYGEGTPDFEEIIYEAMRAMAIVKNDKDFGSIPTVKGHEYRNRY